MHSRLDEKKLKTFCSTYNILTLLETRVPSQNQTIRIVLRVLLVCYYKQFSFGNLRVPFSKFFLKVLRYHCLNFSQCPPLAVLWITHFKVACLSIMVYRRYSCFANFIGWTVVVIGTPLTSVPLRPLSKLPSFRPVVRIGRRSFSGYPIGSRGSKCRGRRKRIRWTLMIPTKISVTWNCVRIFCRTLCIFKNTWSCTNLD
jgi:hypothetical protein